MIFFTFILLLSLVYLISGTIVSLLVPVIVEGIDHPSPEYKERFISEVATTNYFSLPRGQPRTRASIITNKSLPRNKGEPENNTS